MTIVRKITVLLFALQLFAGLRIHRRRTRPTASSLRRQQFPVTGRPSPFPRAIARLLMRLIGNTRGRGTGAPRSLAYTGCRVGEHLPASRHGLQGNGRAQGSGSQGGKAERAASAASPRGFRATGNLAGHRRHTRRRRTRLIPPGTHGSRPGRDGFVARGSMTRRAVKSLLYISSPQSSMRNCGWRPRTSA